MGIDLRPGPLVGPDILVFFIEPRIEAFLPLAGLLVHCRAQRVVVVDLTGHLRRESSRSQKERPGIEEVSVLTPYPLLSKLAIREVGSTS